MVASVQDMKAQYNEPYFLSCDWGTSSFRLGLVELDTGKTVAKMAADQGTKKIFNRWIDYNGTHGRINFYLSFLEKQITRLKRKSSVDFNDPPVVISGMASSSIGVKELSYSHLPIKLDAPDLNVKKIEATSRFAHIIYLISGLCSSDDIMRGEETQLLGLSSISDIENSNCILVGTHSKHITIEGNTMVTFKTYMTGELFDLIATQSILSNSIRVKKDAEPGGDFEKGVLASRNENFLHSLFKIRAHDILHTSEITESYGFLSGLLIGTELKEVYTSKPKPIILWGNSQLQRYYAEALDLLGLHFIQPSVKAAEDITSLGQRIILKQIEN